MCVYTVCVHHTSTSPNQLENVWFVFFFILIMHWFTLFRLLGRLVSFNFLRILIHFCFLRGWACVQWILFSFSRSASMLEFWTWFFFSFPPPSSLPSSICDTEPAQYNSFHAITTFWFIFLLQRQFRNFESWEERNHTATCGCGWQEILNEQFSDIIRHPNHTKNSHPHNYFVIH